MAVETPDSSLKSPSKLNCELKAVETPDSSGKWTSKLNCELQAVELQIPLLSHHQNSTVNSRLLNSRFLW